MHCAKIYILQSYLQICISRLQQDTVGGNYGTSQIINRQELDAIQQGITATSVTKY